MSATFDRVRPRIGDRDRPDTVGYDAEGKRALFSGCGAGEARPATGGVTVTCSRCGSTSLLSPARAVRAAVPSLHVFPLRRAFPSYLRCPACGRLSWVRLGVRF